MEEIRPRITGVETEYGLTYSYQESSQTDYLLNRIVGANPMDKLPFKELPSGVGRSDEFGMLTNGSRYYMDIGQHPEYSTPEATSFKEVVAHDLAGERIVFNSFKRLRENGLLKEFHLNKRVVDMQDMYWGRHENYLVSRELDPNIEIVPQMALHLATRSVWAGAGMVRRNGKFVMAQKMSSIYTLDKHSASAHGRRPLVDIGRDEPLADGSKWRRVHVASVDANMFPWTTWMTLGTTSLVLRMVENGDKLEDLQLSMPVNAARELIHDLKLQKTFPLRESKIRMSALDIQEALAERAGKLAQAGVLPAEESEVAAEWIKLCQDLRGDPEQCLTRVEWIFKQHILGKYALKKEVSLRLPYRRSLDILWDDLDKERGFAQKLRAKGKVPMVVSEEDIQTAVTNPPETRAKLRGQLVESLVRQRRLRDWAIEEHCVNWNHFNIRHHARGTSTKYRIELNDPYQKESTEVEKVLKQMSEL